MINYQIAKKILKKSIIKIKYEKIKSVNSLNRVASANIYSSIDYPSGNNAAFDGFAINSKDTNKLNKSNSQNFKILKTISAGDNPSLKKKNKF
jgi:molybdopterin molybdotransferase